ncbi:MAG TPA: type II toxin-antitoxin system Phd/YefM family antitoxin [Syntrophales bacterium]|nr:type II toxin-antitoxin system Phd/YefM family antitoxin [Syntrophobacterales bacterium]HQL91401.1 type II toxin-antitoxin system Phd/YefM family antitoxin [Syntrophales bacterium]
MKEVNALTLRNRLGEILDRLKETGEPVLVSKGRKARAVMITPEQFEQRFLVYQAEEKKRELLAKIKASRSARLGRKTSLEVLRELRGYEK